MKCTRCGNKLLDRAQFCGACGAPRSRLHPRFTEAEGRFAALQDRYRRGELDAAAYEVALRELIVQDDQGQYWMLGADSGGWYFYDGAQWVPGDPLLEAVPLPAVPPVAVARKRSPWIWVSLVLVVFLVLMVAAAVVVWRFPSLLPFDLGGATATAVPPTAAPTVPPSPSFTVAPTTAVPTPTPTRMPIVAPTAGPTPTPTSTPIPTPTPTQTPRPIFRYYFPLCGRGA